MLERKSPSYGEIIYSPMLNKNLRNIKERYASNVQDYHKLEAGFEELEEANLVLSGTLAAVEKELSVLSSASSITADAENMSFCFTTKSGERIYSPAIRKLYYSLLQIKSHLQRFARSSKLY